MEERQEDRASLAAESGAGHLGQPCEDGTERFGNGDRHRQPLSHSIGPSVDLKRHLVAVGVGGQRWIVYGWQDN